MEIKKLFTEYEWVLITLCPVSSSHAVVFADLGSKVESDDKDLIPKNTSSTIKNSMEKEIQFIYKELIQYGNRYPNNPLIQSILKEIAEKSIQYFADQLSKLSGIVENYPFKDEDESDISKLESIIDEIGLNGNSAEFIKVANLMNLGYAILVLKKKSLPPEQVKEFREFVYAFAEDVANVASESFFGYGRKVSDKEKNTLGFIQRILDL